MPQITHVDAREILDSRGFPTVEADVLLEDGTLGRAAVPSGASTGSNEAHELRDGEAPFGGMSVSKAVANVQTELRDAVVGLDPTDQEKVDRALRERDGSPNKERLGANAILGVSLATAHAAAFSLGSTLFAYIGTHTTTQRTPRLPMPLCNLINGGRHAAGSIDLQECMVVPVGAQSMHAAVQMSAEVFHALKRVLTDAGYGTTVGDEGGFAPAVQGGNREALALLAQAVEAAGYTLGRDVAFALDVAATELRDPEGGYVLGSENRKLDRDGMVTYLTELVGEFPIVSIEDGLAEDDWEGWTALTEALGKEVQLVGDDLTVTNPTFLERAIKAKAGNAVLVKMNQIGTLTETLAAVDMSTQAGWNAIVSHRSGETEDVSIAHLAVGLGTGQIKTGSLSRSERVAKYNELLRIEDALGERAQFARWS